MAVERVEIESAGSPWKEEHLSRYYFMKDRVQDKTVLDIACGTGFGSELLIRSGAAKVFAADVSDEALQECTARISKYGDKAVCHKQDGTRMNYASETFDIVVSFETIEHIGEYRKFLSEIKRVLKPRGILVLSTPNALVTKPENGKPKNPFHVHEFTPQELRDLLSGFFTIELAAGHHVMHSYGVAPFLPSFDRTALSFKQKINFSYWRFARRLPSLFRNGLHRLFFSSSFYPATENYTFLAENLESAHVQYYICRKET